MSNQSPARGPEGAPGFDIGKAISSFDFGKLASRYGILFAIIGLGAFLTFADKYFLTVRNLTNLLVQISPNGLLATGMTFVIIAGGIDLAVGSLLALAGMVFANYALIDSGVPVWVAAIVGVLVGAGLNAVSGVLVASFRVPAFVATLAMMSMARGFLKLYSRGGSIPGPSNSFADAVDVLSFGRIFGLPIPAALFLGSLALAWFVLTFTRFGRYLYAVGGNEKGARVSGVPVKWVTFWAFVVCGAYAGLSGVVVTALNSSAQVITGVGYELDAIAAVVIGGTSLSGGRGNMMGTLFGVILIGLISNGINLLNHLDVMKALGDTSATQDVIKGMVIVFAVLLDIVSRGRKA
jgi:putative xylitol transport system permease protein